MRRHFAIGIAGALLASAFCIGSNPAATRAAVAPLHVSGGALPDTNKKGCDEKKFSGGGFPTDCGNTGGISVPSYTEDGSFSEFGMNQFFCESPQLIKRTADGKFCGDEPSPYGYCKQATATFWYLEFGFKARTLDGYGGTHITFNSPVFPISFTSSSLILPGNKYGLCVVANGATMQDDFAGGKPVRPHNGTIDLKMILTSQYISFWGGEGFLVYLEAGPGGH